MSLDLKTAVADNFSAQRSSTSAVNSSEDSSADEDMTSATAAAIDPAAGVATVLNSSAAPSCLSYAFPASSRAASGVNSAVVNSGSLLPTISVTPYSPIANSGCGPTKHYLMLEDNLRQLHDIVDSVQQMKDDNTAVLYATSRSLYSNEANTIPGTSVRLSCSCPSLNDQDSDSDVQTSFNSSPSYRDASTSLSTSHFSGAAPPPSSVHGGAQRRQRTSCDWAASGTASSMWSAALSSSADETLRRKSWSALEDLTAFSGGQKPAIGVVMAPRCSVGDRRRASTTSRRQQRSISISSLESDYIEDPFTDSTVNLLSNAAGTAIDPFAMVTSPCERRRKSTAALVGGRKNRHSVGGDANSTRSLNEADLQSDFDKIKAGVSKQLLTDENETVGSPAVGSLQTRLPPLQKSVSTPSIFGVNKDAASSTAKETGKKSETDIGGSAAAGAVAGVVGVVGGGPNPSGTESETEEEILVSLLESGSGIAPSINRSSLLNYIIQDGMYANRREKRQKRASLFFRKKKDLPAGNKSKSGSSAYYYTPSSGTGLPSDHVSQFQFQDSSGSYLDETPLLEFLNEAPITHNDLDTDPFLGLQDEEPETWSLTVNKELIKKLKEKEVKRQEHIYELILTEKHHCLTLRVMQRIFVDGLQKYFNLGVNLNRMFPRLGDLTEIHLKFLYMLRERQREAPIVREIGDVLLELFSGESAEKLKSAYGEFCSKHRDAVDIYKYYLQNDANFSTFVRHCQNNPLLKKKGIPECILFVTQRLTKYPLLIEPLIKTSKDNRDELDRLTRALSLVKGILVNVDAKVEEREKDEKKIEIYNKIDPKSFTYFKGKKFKKSSILSNNRKLKFEGVAMLMQGRTKMQMVHVIVLSDILFFLTENNNKFTFVTPYGKEGVISLHKLLVREKAGSDSRGLYLISSNLPNPEMYELKIHKPKEKQTWIRTIRDIIRNCSIDEDYDAISEQHGHRSNSCASTEERQHVYVQQIIEGLRQKDLEQAITLEEKIALQIKLLAADGVKLSSEPPVYSQLLSERTDRETVQKEVIDVLHRVRELTGSFYNTETSLSRSASSVGERQSVAYISPILPKRAETFGGFDNANKDACVVRGGAARKLSQQLSSSRKSAAAAVSALSSSSSENTNEPLKKLSLAGFLEEQQISWKNVLNMMGASFNVAVAAASSGSGAAGVGAGPATTAGLSGSNQQLASQSCQQLPLLLQVDKTVQPILIELTSHMYTLATVIMKQTTLIEDLESRLKRKPDQRLAGGYAEPSAASSDSSVKKEKKMLYNHSQQLEELRNLQDKLTQEREQWHQEKETEERDLEEKRQQLARLQEQIRNEQNDVTLQREQLYRKLELLASQGVHINSDVISSPTGSSAGQLPTAEAPSPPASVPPDACSASAASNKRRSDSMRWKQTMLLSKPTASTSTLPLNLISATNQQKVSSGVQIKQKLPLKLASKLGSGGGGIATGSSSAPSIATGGSPGAAGTSGSGSSVSSSGSPIQQIIPLKLQQGGNESSKHSSSSLYQHPRLSSTDSSFSVATVPSHSRTGSSPAMMQQNCELTELVAAAGTNERTNTYPKIPERYHHRVQSPPANNNSAVNNNVAKKNSNLASEEEVIFF